MHVQENLNVIDINQILSFFHAVQQQTGVDYKKAWARYEQAMIGHMLTTEIDGKNLAIIAHRFSHARQGSLEFWSAIDKAFQAAQGLSNQDYCTLIHSFSLMNLLSVEKFVGICYRIYDSIFPLQPIDLSQIVSTAKNQGVDSGKDAMQKEFWKRTLVVSLKVIESNFDKINRKTFVVLVNSMHYEFSKATPAKRKALWALMDKLLLRHLKEL